VTLEASPPAGDAPAAIPAPKIQVIFICTGNSARSQMAEAILRREAGDRFDVVSAGVTPRPVNPLTIAALARVGIDISQATSKPVGGFLGRRFDYVITLCDRARLTCPVFPGGRETLHWGLDDPTEVEGTPEERRAAFDRVLTEVSGRIRRFAPLAVAQAGR
jgi:thioredoxin type arsenate reductase